LLEAQPASLSHKVEAFSPTPPSGDSSALSFSNDGRSLAFMEFVTVYKALNIADAELMRSRLESADFVVDIENEDVSLGSEAGILVRVPEDRAGEARALLDYKDGSPS
jgi:hypothetical protein